MRKQYFAIVCLGRTGSSHLVSLLNSHPDISCAWEGTLIDPAYTDPQVSVERHVLSSEKPAAGLKLPWEAFQRFPQIFDVMREHSFRVIRLTRENLFDQYISMRLAQETGTWLSDGDGYGPLSFVADPVDVRENLEHFTFANRMLKESTRQFRSVDVTYEELIDGRALGRIFALLEVEHIPLVSAMRKQRAGNQRETVANFLEVSAAFEGTEFACHFTG